jgi:hypothetical protein
VPQIFREFARTRVTMLRFLLQALLADRSQIARNLVSKLRGTAFFIHD